MSDRESSLTLACRDEAQLATVLDQAARADDVQIVDVRSSAPLSEAIAERMPTRRPRVPLFGILGGGLGGLIAYLVATLTAKAYPLVTGHMPIVAAPPVGIITYEGIALGAVLATTLGVLWECRLPRSSPGGAAESRVAAGQLVVLLQLPATRADEFASLAERLDP